MSIQLINSKLKKFYQKYSDQQNEIDFILENNSLNFRQIVKLIVPKVYTEEEAFKCFSCYNYNEFLEIYERLLPIFLEIYEFYELTTPSLNLEWLGENYKCTKLNGNQDTNTVEELLLLTAHIENALGNIFYHKRRENPPHLLRDLLNTKELREFFGWEAVIFLKFLMGTPNSINLRNILWHGFPTIDDIPAYYVAVLLLTIHSLGLIIKNKLSFGFEKRPLIQDFSKWLLQIATNVNISNANILTYFELECILEKCKWLPAPYKSYWKQLFYYYETMTEDANACWRFVILILPQLELLLRLIYAKCNNYDVTAKLDEYYITLDTIFEYEMPGEGDKLNNLFRFSRAEDEIVINEGCMKFMYDIFVSPNGPRLRDKCSHGEVHLPALQNRTLCQLLLLLTIELLDGPQCSNFKEYESNFHLNRLTCDAIQNATKALNEFNESKAAGISFVPTKLKIFHRPRREGEVMLLLLRITQMLIQICENYRVSVNYHQELLLAHRLHSRQRKTFEKLVNSLPEIHGVLVDIWQYQKRYFCQMQSQNEDIFVTTKDLHKFIKFALTICENFVKYSSKDNNEWIKALELCSKFREYEKNI